MPKMLGVQYGGNAEGAAAARDYIKTGVVLVGMYIILFFMISTSALLITWVAMKNSNEDDSEKPEKGVCDPNKLNDNKSDIIFYTMTSVGGFSFLVVMAYITSKSYDNFGGAAGALVVLSTIIMVIALVLGIIYYFLYTEAQKNFNNKNDSSVCKLPKSDTRKNLFISIVVLSGISLILTVLSIVYGKQQ